MLYTRKGDDGTSGVFGQKTRCNKDSPIFHALGTVDELNSLLGVCYAKARQSSKKETKEKNKKESQKEEHNEDISIPVILRSVQEDLFVVQAELAGAPKHLSNEHVARIEHVIANVEVHIENPKAFVISGSDELSAYLDLTRSVARRAEREVLKSRERQAVSKDTRIYLNRLSSLLYVLARYAAAKANVKEQNPKYQNSS